MVPLLDMSTTYAFEDAEVFAKASDVKTGAGYVYTRWANPTVDAFEAAVAALEEAPDAEAFSTGMAAVSSVFLALCSPGDRVVAARQLYGGTFSIATDFLARFGVTVELFDVDDVDAITRALPGATLAYCESIGNPRVVVADIPAIAEAARGAGVPLVVDNTFASPLLCRPLELGATLSLHSATKFLGGHLDLMGGVVCGDEATVRRIAGVARELGPTMSPFNAWLALRGMQTLDLRVERSSRSALVIAEHLAGHNDIAAVHYPALDDSPYRQRCRDLLGDRGGGTLAFEVRGGRDRAARFQDSLRLISPAASLGGTKTLLVHAASVTHTQLDAAALEAAGISEGFCRLSVGLEDADDLVADLDEALAAGA